MKLFTILLLTLAMSIASTRPAMLPVIPVALLYIGVKLEIWAVRGIRREGTRKETYGLCLSRLC
jgi:hypothetical protein